MQWTMVWLVDVLNATCIEQHSVLHVPTSLGQTMPSGRHMPVDELEADVLALLDAWVVDAWVVDEVAPPDPPVVSVPQAHQPITANDASRRVVEGIRIFKRPLFG